MAPTWRSVAKLLRWRASSLGLPKPAGSLVSHTTCLYPQSAAGFTALLPKWGGVAVYAPLTQGPQLAETFSLQLEVVAILPKSPMSDPDLACSRLASSPKRAPIRRNTAGVRHSPFPQMLIPPPLGSDQEAASMPPSAVSLTPLSPMPSIHRYLVSLWSSVGWFCGHQPSIISIFNSTTNDTTRGAGDDQLGPNMAAPTPNTPRPHGSRFSISTVSVVSTIHEADGGEYEQAARSTNHTYRGIDGRPLREAGPDPSPNWKPFTLRWPFLLLLTAVVLALIGVTEWACRSLPVVEWQNPAAPTPTDDLLSPRSAFIFGQALAGQNPQLAARDPQAEGKPVSKPGGDSKPGETKPGETKPGETKPGETKPGETKPGETKPGETKPGETKPGEPSQVRASRMRVSQARPSRVRPNQARPSQAR
ncbi:hypothetical protein MAPG_01365, partial [Magnaporthiopsis poae ATCC 64411]